MTTMNSGIGRWTKRLLGGLGILVIGTIILAVTSMGMTTTAGSMPMWDGHMWGSGGWLGWGLMWLVGLLWMVVLMAIPITVIYWLVGGRAVGQTDDSALTVLRERYARGEIDDEEYEARRAALETR